MSEKSSTQVHPSGELLKKAYIVSEWGQVAFELLVAIRGREAKKKRATILKMADFVAQGKPLIWAFRLDYTGSKSIHYRKWMKHDLEYQAAYRHMIGGNDSPGIARAVFEQEQMETTADCVAALSRAMSMVQIQAPRAIEAAADLLTAETKQFFGFDSDGAAMIETIDDNTTRLGAAKWLGELALLKLPKAQQDREAHEMSSGEVGAEVDLSYVDDWREVHNADS